ncbi:6-phosphofructokinase, partial [bacterium]|nr:6-phosphofructokinase [bacterium]
MNSDGEKIKIGVMTSGGDAQGMNAAIRAVVRTALHFGAEVYCIHEGYVGLQYPEKHVKKMAYKDVSGILGEGGTILGTARCKEMMGCEGRRKAVHSLLSRGIDRLVCIGGDGSLNGANLLCKEWQDHIKALVEEGSLPSDTLEKHPRLYVVGMPGTIDNDMHGSDITIGADTALHRITEAVDAIFSTADSHQRTFVVEVMGRHCGYLALMAGLATGAEWVLIPENPCPKDWEDQMVRDLQGGKDSGKRASIVIVAEGARGWLKYDEKTGPAKDDDKLILDEAGHPTHKQGQISSEYVKNVLSHKFGADTRVTILGHVQRGGIPSSYDRNLATMLGIEAAKIVIGEKEPVFSEGSTREIGSESVLIGMHNNKIRAVDLADFVRKTNLAQEAAKDTNSNYDKPFEGREHLKKIYRLFQVINSNGNEDRLKSLEEKEQVIKRVAKDKQKNIA